ncbi:MAG: hypothetical protein J6X28_03205 [Bacilli bacterium]|nr:hypothetical protein [Bacilli bacterium]
MSSLYVDYNLLTQSITSLSDFSRLKGQENVFNTLDSAVSQILNVSSMHDGCFDGISADSLYQDTDAVSLGIDSLVSDMEQSLDASIEYSLGLGDKRELKLFDGIYMIDEHEEKGFESMSIQLFSDYLHRKFGNGTTPLNEVISKDILLPGYETTYYNDAFHEMNDKLSKIRLKVVADAMFLATEFPHISYFWAAGHQKNQDGVNPDWGTIQYDNHFNEQRVYGMDCSGFVNWALYNGGVSTDSIDCFTTTNSGKGEKSYYNLGNCESITAEGVYGRVKAGDIAYMKGHVGMIVYKDNDCITVAHVCDSDCNVGMCLTKIDTKTGLIVDDSSKPDRIGQPYFTNVVEVVYDDEKNV